MRIITGKYKGKSLAFPKDKALFRPTQSRAKEAIFDRLGADCENANVVDICCGTGAFGLEALSRGANFVTFLDIETSYAIQNIKKIVELTERPQVKIIKGPAQRSIKNLKGPVDIIFFDPPWHEHELYGLILNQILQFDILSPSGEIIVETRKKSKIVMPEGFNIKYETTYGDTRVTSLTL